MFRRFDMEVLRATILAVGRQLPSIQVADSRVRVVRASTLRTAVRELKRRTFHLVVVQAGLKSSWDIRWVRRLRAAKPYLPVIVCLGGRSAAPEEETRMRAAGVAAVTNEQLLEGCLEQWWVAWVGKNAN